jgi:hypothetical protein
MSNEAYMDKAEVVIGTGQCGKALNLTFDQLNVNEQTVLSCLRGAGERMKIGQIVIDNGWDKPSKTKGNSMVRNAMRRLVRSGMVLHNSKIGDGTYVAADLVSGSMRNPKSLTVVQVSKLHADPKLTDGVKKADCTFYNACLDQAISGKWAGFACTSCNAYAEADPFQKQMDQLGLACINRAADLVEKYGKVHRVRGVKPGADAKRTRRLPVVETVSLGEVLANCE